MTKSERENIIKVTFQVTDKEESYFFADRSIPSTSFLKYGDMIEIMAEISESIINHWIDLKYKGERQ